MTAPLVWLVGAGGLLGSRLRVALPHHLPDAHFWQPTPARFTWTNPFELVDQLSYAVESFAAAVRDHGDAWVLLWCAGKGVLSSPAAALEPEWLAWKTLLALLARPLPGPLRDFPGYAFLASSAGGIYGENRSETLTEWSLPDPKSEYGMHKLRMEKALHEWATEFSNVSCLAGRISTLYGPGQDLSKAQGIISHLSRCLLHRQSLHIYVPLDTRRDYLFADDCAEAVAASLVRLVSERPRFIVKIFASERLTSIAEILGVFFRIVKHHPLIVLALQSRQPTSLKMRSDVWRDCGGRMTDLAAGIQILHAHQMAQFQLGLFPRLHKFSSALAT